MSFLYVSLVKKLHRYYQNDYKNILINLFGFRRTSCEIQTDYVSLLYHLLNKILFLLIHFLNIVLIMEEYKVLIIDYKFLRKTF